MVKGKSFTGTLAAFGECVMLCKPKTNTRRKGDSVWEVGVFLGKTENNLFLTGMHGEVRASRSAEGLADDYRGELVAPVKTFPWQIKQSVLTTKVIPVLLWKMLQLKLKIQLCQNLLILPSQAEKKDQSWKEVQEIRKLQEENYIRHFSEDK